LWEPYEAQMQSGLEKCSVWMLQRVAHTLPRIWNGQRNYSQCYLSYSLRHTTTRACSIAPCCTTGGDVYLWWLCDSHMRTESFRLAKVWRWHPILKYGNSKSMKSNTKNCVVQIKWRFTLVSTNSAVCEHLVFETFKGTFPPPSLSLPLVSNSVG
jgi:hypothetical protein